MKQEQTSTLAVAAYLGHLLAPAALLLDVLSAATRGEISLRPGDAETVVAVLAATWLVGGILALGLSADRHRFLRRMGKPLVSIYAVYFMLALFEVGGRAVAWMPPAIPGVQTPGTTRVQSMDLAELPGVSGIKRFTLNRLGLRGPMPPRDGKTFRIVAVGGSTTICVVLDDAEAWPQVVMDGLNADERARKRVPVWVGNAGVNGANTVDHLSLLQWLPGVVPADMVIFLTGVNDLQATLAFEGAPTEAFLEKGVGYRGELPPGTRLRSWYPLYRRTFVFNLFREAARRVGRRLHWRGVTGSSNERPYDIPTLRAKRAAGSIVPLPDLTTGLAEYRGRIAALGRRCRVLEARCLFLTQPSLWRPDLGPTEERLVWLGYVGRFEHPKGYLSSADLEQAMDEYNRALLEVCHQTALECYDLAANLPKDTSVFNDDVHFNEAGSLKVAQIVTRYLLARAPFGGQSQ